MINNVSKTLKVVHVKPIQACITRKEVQETECGPVETIVRYFNYLPNDVTIVERSGFRHVVASRIGSTNNPGKQQFIIRTEIRIRTEASVTIRKLLSQTDARFNYDISLIKEIFLDKHTGSWNCGSVITIDHCITQDTMVENGGSIYCKPKDLVISTINPYKAPSHPFCEDTIEDFYYPFRITDSIHKGSPAFRIEIIDNDNEIGNRYTYVFGDLVEITPKIDNRRQSGVYLSYVRKDLTEETGYTIDQKRFEFSELESALGIFKTKEEARAAGDVSTARKEELARKEHENAVLKQELLTSKANLDKIEHERAMEKIENQKKLDDLDARRREAEFQRDMRREERKDDYDRRSSERKDFSEMMKFLPYLVIAVGGIVAAFAKTTSSK